MPEGKDRFNPDWSAADKAAYNAGRRAGYGSDGYVTGHNDGSNGSAKNNTGAGHTSGQEGKGAAYDAGYADGWEEAYNDGYKDGSASSSSTGSGSSGTGGSGGAKTPPKNKGKLSVSTAHLRHFAWMLEHEAHRLEVPVPALKTVNVYAGKFSDGVLFQGRAGTNGVTAAEGSLVIEYRRGLAQLTESTTGLATGLRKLALAFDNNEIDNVQFLKDLKSLVSDVKNDLPGKPSV